MRRLTLRYGLGLAIGGAMAGTGTSAAAQVTLDGTLGRGAGPLAGPNFQIGAELGRQAGGNLFHSFGQFNLNTGESATFSGPGSVANVIGRVTGGNGSTIDGTLRSTIPGANLFLFNPSGMAFGPNARLDVQGAFHASTADYLGFADGARFDAKTPANSTLTVAEPRAFGFLGPTANPLTITGSQLAPAAGANLSLIGGAVSLNGTQIATNGGSLQIVSAAGAGEVAVTPGSTLPTAPTRLGDVTISGGSLVDVSGARAGGISIRGGQIVVDNSLVGGFNISSQSSGGAIEVHGNDSVTVRNGGTLVSATGAPGAGGALSVSGGAVSVLDLGAIQSFTVGGGAAGNIAIAAGGPVVVSGSRLASPTNLITSTILTQSGPSATGRAGDITIGAASLSVLEGGTIKSTASGAGAAGNIAATIQGPILVSNLASPGTSLITTSVADGPLQGSGHIALAAPSLRIEGLSQIVTNTVGAGRGGDIAVNAAESVTLVDGGQIATNAEFGGGGAGDIAISTTALTLGKQAIITSFSQFLGPAGNVTIVAPQALTMVNEIDAPSPTSIGSNGNGFANSGNVTITTGDLTMVGNALISTGTTELSNAGNITIVADSLTMRGLNGTNPSTISTSSFFGSAGVLRVDVRGDARLEQNATIQAITGLGLGDVGRIDLTAGKLTVAGSSSIDSSAFGLARGGDLNVTVAGPILITGQFSLVSSSTLGIERGGTVTLRAATINIEDLAKVAANTFGDGRGGDVVLEATGPIVIDGKRPNERALNTGVIAKSATSDGVVPNGDAGNVTVVAPTIEIRNAGAILSDTDGPGKGGNVSVSASRSLTLRNGGIVSASTTEGSTGRGGSVRVETPNLLLQDGGQIIADTLGTGKGGNVDVIVRGPIAMVQDPATPIQNRVSAGGFVTATGDAGDVVVEAASLIITGGGVLGSQADGGGAGGNVRVKVDGNIAISGRDALEGQSPSRITARTDGPKRAGNVTVEAGSITLENFGTISSSTQNAGDGGNVQVIVRDGLDIRGNGAVTGIFAQSEPAMLPDRPQASTGNAGNVFVDTKTLTLFDGAQISSATNGPGRGGSVQVVARERIEMRENGTITGIFAQSNPPDGTGRAGTVSVTTDKLDILGINADTTISSAGFGQRSGGGGDVSVTVREAVIAGLNGSIRALSQGTGTAGTISITADRLTLRDGGSITTQSAFAAGGAIDIQARELVYLLRGEITTSVASGVGGGGNITIDPRFVVLNNGRIVAQAVGGDGGNITIVADNFLATPNSVIDASSQLGIDGAIVIEAPQIDVSGGLVTLASEFLDRSDLARDACARGDRPVSSLAPVGRGALPQEPEGAQPGLYLAERTPTLAAPPMTLGHAIRLAAIELSPAGLSVRCGGQSKGRGVLN